MLEYSNNKTVALLSRLSKIVEKKKKMDRISIVQTNQQNFLHKKKFHFESHC